MQENLQTHLNSSNANHMSAELNVQMSPSLKQAALASQNQYHWQVLDKSYYRDPTEMCLMVNMNVVVLNLCDIDTLSQSYIMKAELWVAWPLLEEEAIAYCKNPEEWKPVLHPRPTPWTVSIDQNEPMIFPNDRSIQIFIYDGKLMACECTLISARFLEGMELESFPFDCQHLTFHIGLRCDCDIPMRLTDSDQVEVKDVKAIDGFMNFDGRAMMSMKLNKEACCFNVRSQYLSISDFDLQNIECEIENMPDDIPFLHCSLRMSRNWQAYIFRVVVTMFFIMIVACVAFRFADGDLQDRLNFIATMLLTAVAFLFIVSGWLPQLKYLTLIDKYMMTSFAFLTAVAFQMVIFDYYGFTKNKETIAMWINFAIIIVHHIVFAFYGWKMRSNELKKLARTRREIEASYDGTAAGQSKEQFICHTKVSKKCPFNDIMVYEGGFRDENSGWMMPK